MAAVPSRLKSGWQRERRSGRGFPNSNFMPWVTKNAVASDNASPIQPVFHSQSFLLQMSDFGVPRLAVGPGTKTMQTRKMMAAGITSETTTNSQVGIISDVWKGYDMSRLTRENGRLNGVRYSQPAPTAAIALRNCQSWFRFDVCVCAVAAWFCSMWTRVQRATGYRQATFDVHDAYPIEDVRQHQPY